MTWRSWGAFFALLLFGLTVGKTAGAQTPEAQTPCTQTPEAQTPEAQAPCTQTPEPQMPEPQTPEAQAPEAQTPEAQAPEAQTPEAQVPEAQEPEAQTPDQAQETAAGSPAEKLNPYTGDEEAIAAGRKLFLKFNCYGCHGTQGGGGMGKPINDTRWAYGGDDASVLETIRNGREGGMPAFRDILTEDEIWKVMAFLRSLYKGDPEAIVW
ncbi:MAG: c-type cytochrome [Gemmatimonadota bacterium]